MSLGQPKRHRGQCLRVPEPDAIFLNGVGLKFIACCEGFLMTQSILEGFDSQNEFGSAQEVLGTVAMASRG